MLLGRAMGTSEDAEGYLGQKQWEAITGHLHALTPNLWPKEHSHSWRGGGHKGAVRNERTQAICSNNIIFIVTWSPPVTPIGQIPMES